MRYAGEAGSRRALHTALAQQRHQHSQTAYYPPTFPPADGEWHHLPVTLTPRAHACPIKIWGRVNGEARDGVAGLGARSSASNEWLAQVFAPYCFCYPADLLGRFYHVSVHILASRSLMEGESRSLDAPSIKCLFTGRECANHTLLCH